MSGGGGSSPKVAVPYLHEKQIEREANLLLDEYALKFEPILVPPVPVDDIAEVLLNLTLEYLDMKTLFPCGDVHGAIWFQRSCIGIDQKLDPHTHPEKRGRYHFTLAHEVGHWRLHRHVFSKKTDQRSLFDDGTPHPDVICRSTEQSQPVEWQANAFASSLLMPRKLVFAAWDAFRKPAEGPVAIDEIRALYSCNSDESDWYVRGRLATDEKSRDTAMKETFCKPLAETFQVSAEAMRIRLEQLSLLVTKKTKSLF